MDWLKLAGEFLTKLVLPLTRIADSIEKIERHIERIADVLEQDE